jgi:hypothetical protein
MANSVCATPSNEQRVGEIPKYLIQRKLEWAKREQDRLARLQQEKYIQLN